MDAWKKGVMGEGAGQNLAWQSTAAMNDDFRLTGWRKFSVGS